MPNANFIQYAHYILSLGTHTHAHDALTQCGMHIGEDFQSHLGNLDIQILLIN